jgi:Holliday junction DNA helicase RuvA
MIGRLIGEVVEIRGRALLLDVHGVGFEIECSRACIDRLRLGEKVTVITYTEVREDAIRLHGFADFLERQVFLLLLKVKGVGVKSASELLSQIDKCDLLRFIGVGDVKSLSGVRGVGKKSAERIVVELKDKVAEFALIEREVVASESRPQSARGVHVEGEAFAALCALGFSTEQARVALVRLKEATPMQVGPFTDAGSMVSAALRYV